MDFLMILGRDRQLQSQPNKAATSNVITIHLVCPENSLDLAELRPGVTGAECPGVSMRSNCY